MKWVAAAMILAGTATGASSCSTTTLADTSCADGKGTWMEDESDALKGGYTVIVRLCIDDGGNVLDMEVD